MEYRSIQLKTGDDILNELKIYSYKNNISGYIVGVVGDMSKVIIKCPNNNSPFEFNGILEIITLNGTIASDKIHLHLSFSNSECKVLGGHLENGSLVHKGLDILIAITHKSNNKEQNKHNPKLDRIEVFVVPNCAWCSRTIRILNSKRIPYNLITVTDEIIFNQTKRRSGSSIFPQIFIDGGFLGGYQEFTNLVDSGKINEFKS